MVANNLLDAEATVKADEREKFLAEKCPSVELPYSKDELMVRPNRTDCPGSVRDKMLSGLFITVNKSGSIFVSLNILNPVHKHPTKPFYSNPVIPYLV